ncbi:MAG: hypothetical protein JW852_00785 [Spirochaetales bacterium]|nr:hypothetical protein [Spirochaetales bacterium]
MPQRFNRIRITTKPIRALLVYALAFLAFSCTVQTEITIHDDASGRAEVTVTLHPAAVMYMSDISASLGGVGAGGVSPFDIEAIRRAFLSRPGVKLESIETVGDDTLLLEAVFDDVSKLLAGPAGGMVPAESGGQRSAASHPGLADEDPLSFSINGESRKLTLQLTRSNFNRISSLFILPDSPVTVLLPYAENDFMPKDEYLEVLAYALEDYLGATSVEEFVQNAGVYATVRTGRPVKAAQGGEISNGRAEFFVPLIDALTLEEDIRRSVAW